MKKSLLIALVITVGTFSLVSARYHGRGPMHRANLDGEGFDSCMQPLMMMPWEKIETLADEIKLDKAQLDAIEKARITLQDQNDLFFKEIDELKTKLHQNMIQIDDSDLETALELSNKMSDLRNQYHQNRIKSVYELKKILTPEQHEQLREILRDNRYGRSGQGCGYGPGAMRRGSPRQEDAPRQRTGQRKGGRR